MPFGNPKFFGKNGRIEKNIIAQKLKSIENLSKILKDRNLKIYHMKGCGWCKKQIEDIEKYLPELKNNLVEYTRGIELPKEVNGFPSWVLDSSKKDGKVVLPGYKNIEALKELKRKLNNGDL